VAVMLSQHLRGCRNPPPLLGQPRGPWQSRP